jgi:ribonuclease HI
MEQVRQVILELELPRPSKQTMARLACTWHGPPDGYVKLNLDGAICIQEGTSGSGGVARDATGFRGAWSKVYQGISDPLCAEAMAFRDAVLFAQARNFRSVIFETDYSELVRCWEARQTDRSMSAPMLQDVNKLVSFFSLSSE